MRVADRAPGLTPARRYLFKVDHNFNNKNKLSVRYNLLNSSSDILLSNSASLGLGNRRSSLNSLNFANSNYAILENLRSIVGEWNSALGGRMSNNLIVGYNSSDESRKVIRPPWFPLVEILNANTNYTTFGFEPFTPDNQLTYHSYQFQDNFTIYMQKHSLTFGASVEKYHSNNVFFPGAQSVYVYNSLADWYTDANDYLANPGRTVSPVTLRRFQVRYSNIPGQTEPVQPLDVLYYGVYAQDEWRPIPNLTLTGGLRIDAPKFKNTAYDNPVADTMSFRDAGGATVHAYDPEAMKVARSIFGAKIQYAESGYAALTGADALAIVTEWNEFREPDYARMRKLMRSPVIFDGRNLYSPDQIRAQGFTYFSIGRP